MSDSHRTQVVATVRQGYAAMQKHRVAAGITNADEDAAGPPAASFATWASTMREAAALVPGTTGGANLRSDAEAMRMFSELCQTHGVTWTEVR